MLTNCAKKDAPAGLEEKNTWIYYAAETFFSDFLFVLDGVSPTLNARQFVFVSF
jgi:hypothetical protein